MRDSAHSQIKGGLRPPPQRAPSARASSSLLQHWLKCCVHLHLERHIKFVSVWSLVVLGWAHEKSDVWVKLTFTLSLDGRCFYWDCFIVLFVLPFGWHRLFIKYYVGPVGNNHTHTYPVNHHKIRRKFVILQNEYFRKLKTNRNLIVNDFDKPYIAIVFASWHLQVNTRRDLFLGLTTIS